MKSLEFFKIFVGVSVLLLFADFSLATPAKEIEKNTIEHAVGACHFRIESGMFGGNFEVHSEGTPTVGIFTYPDTSSENSVGLLNGFTLFCVDASDQEIGVSLSARQVNGKWFRYTPWPRRDETEFTPFERGAHPQTVQFKGGNWSGIGLTIDDTTGDEKRRARTFYFCLIHQAHALCGKSPVQWLDDPTKRNELWKIKAILQSVEFVDATPLRESSPENGAASAPKQ